MSNPSGALRSARPKITIADVGDPVFMAMLQAMYSRSPMPIADRLKELGAEFVLNPIQYMDNGKVADVTDRFNKYHVGYGHKSIGELGSCVIFIENVSFVAAKAVQHHPLYKGQEVSTRYVDFSSQPMSSFGDAKLAAKQLAFYTVYLNATKRRLHRMWRGGEKLNATERNAINAKAFDVARGFLPLGMSTSLAWTTDFANAKEHLLRMAVHPMHEVQELAKLIAEHLELRYPKAFVRGKDSLSDNIKTLQVEAAVPSVGLRSSTANDLLAWWNREPVFRARGPNAYSTRRERAGDEKKNWWTPVVYPAYMDAFDSRNDRYVLEGSLDYGSWRDLARHRNGMTHWVTPVDGLAGQKFSLRQLGKTYESLMQSNGTYFADTAVNTGLKNHGFTAREKEAIKAALYAIIPPDLLNSSLRPLRKKPNPVSVHNVILGAEVPVYMLISLAQARYLFKLRTQETVHHTLRKFLLTALIEGEKLQYQDQWALSEFQVRNALNASTVDSVREILQLEGGLDQSPPSVLPSMKRGTQTITKKE